MLIPTDEIKMCIKKTVLADRDDEHLRRLMKKVLFRRSFLDNWCRSISHTFNTLVPAIELHMKTIFHSLQRHCADIMILWECEGMISNFGSDR